MRTRAAAASPSTSVLEQLGITTEDVGRAVSPEEYARWNGMCQSCPIERAYVVPQSDITVRPRSESVLSISQHVVLEGYVMMCRPRVYFVYLHVPDSRILRLLGTPACLTLYRRHN